MKNAYVLGVLLPLALAAAPGASAATATAPAKDSAAAGESVGNPPVLGNSATPRAGSLLLRPPTATARPHTGQARNLDLFVTFTDGFIRNPPQGRPDPVRLRSYRGTSVDPNHPYVAPTIEATPGDTVRIKLHNDLPADPDCTHQPAADINTPHCFNGTNLHSHGVWVSPTGNSDNVLVSINPGVSFEYEYNIPADHPAGTYWYHPHRHGSTALQVGSGMAGAFIIRGDRPPTEAANGDLDTLLTSRKGRAMTDRVLLMEQIPYACTKDGKLKHKADGSIDWSCAAGEVGEIVSYDQFAPQTWEQSGRFTTINGRVRPMFANAVTGQAERWRLIHAGVRSPITVEFRKLDITDFFAREKALSAANQDRFVKDLCVGKPVPYILAASDGLTMGQGQVRTSVPMQPGYRDDLLVNFPEAGIYCVVNKGAAANSSPDQAATSTGVLGFVRVKGDRVVKDPVKATLRQLSANAGKYAPAVARQVVADLNARCDGALAADTPYCPRFSKFTAHPTVTDQEVKGQPKQELVFYINLPTATSTLKAAQFQVANDVQVVENPDGTYGPKGASAYQPAVVDRPVVLGTAQQWELQSYFVSHPFHIHVNPFEIMAIIGPDGRDVSEPGSGDPDYAGMKGVWKDTIWVKSDITSALSSTEPPKGTYKVVIRTRYERFIGEYVLHCHILDHEDQGMMQNVSIGVPDGHGGTAGAHH
ncbi:multicopper oxidase family protein [Azospirillum sp. TSO35-2]|uniref:multicopper oxidase family protein n=1 Tax=Azospirillum sp. TSO35-2 TaxID=716796 RepID=UPI000D607098|nr:multicopper oxidase family protein [Azospirillum sp. TSO35-2]PWC36633.1 L-ascorbate oxidase [Azospirillum sp. TSO35-2]